MTVTWSGTYTWTGTPALTWIEDKESRKSTIVRLGRKAPSSYLKSYKVFGTSDDQLLHADCNGYISNTLQYWNYPTMGGAASFKLRAESYSTDYLGDECFKVTIQYEKAGADDLTVETPAPLRRTRQFDTSGGTAHITQAKSETAYALAGATATARKSAINVNGDRVDGVDIVEPALSWTETYDVPSAYVTSAYIKTAASLTGTVNDAAFRTFAAGEVLFLGLSGSQESDTQKGNGPWSLSYKFVASPNAGASGTIPAITVGDITGIEKKGHDYMWVNYQQEANSSTSQLYAKPIEVYVNKVYRDGSFSSLGIGTTGVT
jgi:hypothetical protein